MSAFRSFKAVLAGVLTVSALALTACGGGVAPSLSVAPKTQTLVAGGSQVTMNAALGGSNAAITWSLNPGVGTLSATTGASISYTPPASVASATTVTLTAVSGALSDSATFTINPPPKAPAGTLVFDIASPSGATNFKANVRITNASGFNQPVTGSQSVSLAPGSYTITVADGRSSGAAADTLFQATLEGPGGNPRNVTVSDGSSTSFTVSHVPFISTGKLWLTSLKASNSFADAVLSGDAGNQNSSDVLNFPTDREFQSTLIDASGDLWVNTETALAKFSGSTLKLLGVMGFPQDAPNGTETISARNMAFDSAGTLWVVDGSNNQRVLGYTTADLAKVNSFDPKVGPKTLEPTHRINLPFNPFTTAAVFLNGIAFDAAGNMWLSDIGSNGKGKLFRLDAANKAINLTIPATRPLHLAFDKKGSLWVSGEGLSRFDAPFAATSSAGLVLKNAGGAVAFDGNGAMWAASAGGLLQFSAAQLALTGIQTPAPVKTLDKLPGGTGLVFAPGF